MSLFLSFALGNAGAAVVIAGAALLLTPLLRRWPAVEHLAWTAVMARLLAPPMMILAVLPAPNLSIPETTPTSLPATTAAITFESVAAPSFFSLQQAAVALWLFGVVLILTVQAVRTVRFRQCLAPSIAPEQWLQTTAHEMARKAGLSGSPRVVVVDAVLPPLVTGLWRPLVVIPATLTRSLTRPEITTLLAHELAHVRRRDPWVRILETLATGLFWWHPAAWLASRRVREAEERACDHLVARMLPDGTSAYARALVATAEMLVGSRSFPAPATTASKSSNLKGRLMRILDRRHPRPLPGLARLALGLILLASLVVSPSLSARAGPDNGAVQPTTQIVDSQLSDLPAAPTAPSLIDPEGLRAYVGRRLSIALNDVPLSGLLGTISQLTDLQFMLDPGIDVTLTIQVFEVPWDQVLDSVLRTHHLVALRDGDRIRISRAASSDHPTPASKLSRPAVERGVHRFTHGGEITAPRKISGDSPTYNDEAREARIQGVVILDVVIDEHGEITETSVIRGLPLGLTEAAKEAVSGWRYEPATLDGEPLAVRFVVTARFSLDLEISE